MCLSVDNPTLIKQRGLDGFVTPSYNWKKWGLDGDSIRSSQTQTDSKSAAVRLYGDCGSVGFSAPLICTASVPNCSGATKARWCTKFVPCLKLALGFRLQVGFARIYTFPIHIMLTKFAKQHITWYIEAKQKRLGFVFGAKRWVS